jgi:tetratricopeptide (TPR) repeat protein
VVLNPRLAEALLNRGLLLAGRKQYPDALADLEAARTAGLDPAAAHYNLAAVLFAAGDRAAAARHLTELLRIDPRHAGGLALQDRLARS